MIGALFLILLVLYMLDINRKTIVFGRFGRNVDYTPKKYIIFFTIILFFISAMRADTVGVDTPSYLWRFMRGEYLDVSRQSLFVETEAGFLLLQKFFALTGLGFRGLLFFCSAFTIIPVGIYIFRNSSKPFVSFFLYITLDYYFFSMTGLRQSLAIGICLLALIFVEKRKVLPFLIMVIAAWTIHQTAIIFLPIYFLARIQIKKKHVLILLGIGVFLYIFKSPIRVFIRSFARIDYSAMNTGGTGYYLMMVAIVLVYFFLIDQEKIESSVKIPVNMVIISTLFFPILQYNPSILRLHYYYSIALIILIPNTITRIKDARVRFGVGFIFFAVPLYYFLFYTSRNMGVLPYTMAF